METLVFSSRLFGRSEELSKVKNVFQRVTSFSKSSATEKYTEKEEQSNYCPSEILLVQGSSGTGKSSLVHQIRYQIETEKSEQLVLFISGKFDQTISQNTPYSALAVAFGELCDHILATSKDQSTQITKKLASALGSEATLLFHIIPQLDQILVDFSINNKKKSSNVLGSKEASNQIMILFRSFLRVVCKQCRIPVVLFLDDLQWADAASLNVFHSLVTDFESRNVLFVGAYRNDEADSYHPIKVRIEKIEQEASIRTTTIQLANLNIDQVNDMISDLLQLEPPTTMPLTTVVYRKTQGNAFFVTEFLKTLQQEELLQFSFQQFRWTWNMHEIEEQTNVSENIVQLVSNKMKKLDGTSQHLLKIASCLGSHFHASTIIDFSLSEQQQQQQHNTEQTNQSTAQRKEETKQCPTNITKKTPTDIATELHSLAIKGLIEEGTEERHKFAHDRIQQGAYSLFADEKERQLSHFRIGKHFFGLMKNKEISSAEDERMLFVTVSQLNQGSSFLQTREERMDLARLNMKAGKKAMATSAFVAAEGFFNASIQFVKENTIKWDHENYSFMLELFTVAAEMAFCNGNHEECQALTKEVVENAKSTQDKLDAYLTLINSFMGEGRTKEALETNLFVLSKLGEPVPKRIFTPMILIDLMRTRVMLKNPAYVEISSLPMMENEDKIRAMEFLVSLFNITYFLENLPTLLISTLRAVRLTCRYGLNEHSAFAIASYGMIMAASSHFKEAHRFGQMALRCLEQSDDSGKWKCRVMVVVHSFTQYWQAPIQLNLEPLLESYYFGMRSGDIEFALISIHSYCLQYFWSGLQLHSLEEDLRLYCQQMIDYKQDIPLVCALPLWQMVLNLMGKNQTEDSAPFDFNGEAMIQKDYVKKLTQANNPRPLLQLSILRAQIAYYFGNLEVAREMIGKDHSIQRGHFHEVELAFYDSLVSIASAREVMGTTAAWRYKYHARRVIRRLKKWVNLGLVNSAHMLLLAQAEYASLKRPFDRTARKLYDLAISTAGKAGFIQDKALSNERAGIFFLEIYYHSLGSRNNNVDKENDDFYWASHYLVKAHELYVEWGAQAKADHLRKSHSEIFVSEASNIRNSDAQIATTTATTIRRTGFKSRSRFTKAMEKMHKKSTF